MDSGEQDGGAKPRAAEADQAASGPAAEGDRARRYLDLWERNLSYFALNGPIPGGPPPGR